MSALSRARARWTFIRIAKEVFEPGLEPPNEEEAQRSAFRKIGRRWAAAQRRIIN